MDEPSLEDNKLTQDISSTILELVTNRMRNPSHLPQYLYHNELDFARKSNILWNFICFEILPPKFARSIEVRKYKLGWKKHKAPESKESKGLFEKVKNAFLSDRTHTYYKGGVPGIFFREDFENLMGIRAETALAGLIPILGYKNGGQFADPNVGDVAINKYLMRKFYDDISVYVYITSDICNRDFILSKKNKLTRYLKKVDGVILHNGENVFPTSLPVCQRKKKCEEKIGEDFITSLILFTSLVNDDVELNFVQTPGGSWSNLQFPTKRNEERGDFIYRLKDSKVGGETKEGFVDLLGCRQWNLWSCLY
jgi:hypothetical protein